MYIHLYSYMFIVHISFTKIQKKYIQVVYDIYSDCRKSRNLHLQSLSKIYYYFKK